MSKLGEVAYLMEEAGKGVCRGWVGVGVGVSLTMPPPPPGSAAQSTAEVLSRRPRPVMEEAQDTCDAGRGQGASGRQ